MAIGPGASQGRSSSAMTVSIVIPCYNYGKFLGAAIESVLDQNYTYIELIVVDDGSTDDTAAVAARYDGVRIIQIKNSGLAIARNTGTRASKGDFLWFLDADDMLAPGAVESSVALLKGRPDCAFAYGHESAIGPFGSIPSGGLSPGKCLTGDLYEKLLRANDCLRSPSAVMHRRSHLDSAGGFTDGIYGCEDFDLHLRLMREHEVVCNDRVVVKKRVHGDNLSLMWDKMLEGAVRAHRLQKPFVNQNPRYRNAYVAGLRVARGYNGGMLARQIARKVVTMRKKRLASDLMVLMKYAPEQLIKLPAYICLSAARHMFSGSPSS